ncbi:mediator of RNA polymerase II transcription subunit 7 [Sporormia fimetaria CBS 119925]|uniref:Mediator of RNA polymerase II transcription subunit 7 n=1 Tax=Sporormia fimetaria CBS 119925 TaxID=1340428 RepID=A0A6A6UZB9_9PLEO|nr:mediator of RNA polymerase II transcription subunit 7 [Sporormia fimetaria CBS 119925]
MADEQEFATPYPAPPPFWKSFTSSNLERLDQFKKDAGLTDSDDIPAAQLAALPQDLKHLVPPEPPADNEEYRIFGASTKIADTDRFSENLKRVQAQLEETGWLPGWQYEQLYPARPAATDDDGAAADWTVRRQQYLVRFVRSLLLNYLELLGVLVTDPTSEDKTEKLKDMLNLVANAQALVNDYRPHQARESLILMMEDQLEQKMKEVEAVRKMKGKVEATLEEFGKSAPLMGVNGVVDEPEVPSPEVKRKNMQRKLWDALSDV